MLKLVVSKFVLCRTIVIFLKVTHLFFGHVREYHLATVVLTVSSMFFLDFNH